MKNDQCGQIPDDIGASFLERDFNQCFAQMRHYDGQIWNICRFTFTAYTAIVGVSIGLYKYSVEKDVELIPAAVAVLGVGLVVGLFMFCLAIRNRVYFVLVTRYINEHRRLFLKDQPYGFENESKMYTNPKQPPYWNWLSSQSWFTYMIAGLNAFLLGVLTYILRVNGKHQFLVATIVALELFLIELILAVRYLKSREGKSASTAVFGKE